MRTNLIQSYLNNPNQNQRYNSEKAVKEFDVHKELTNRTFIKPLPSNGKLVENDLSSIPSEAWKDAKYNFRAFRHAIKGTANDHELGRLNDVGMFLGGLTIAGYLFTRKQTPTTKLFEFIGLGTFFAAMSLWPKLFLQLPAKLIHGINIRQEYKDNYGRKKMFYQDHQFIPWDLYSDKEINKIGDRMNVPTDIPNRREYIQEKMRKIALQNNTMWMLTAGFATPILSALMCNVLEKPVSKYLNNHLDQKANNLIVNLQDEIKNYDYTKNTKELEALLTENTGKPVTPELFEKLFTNISQGIDPVTKSSIKLDLKRLMPGETHVISDDAVKNIQKEIRAHFAQLNLPEEELNRIVPDIEALKSALSQNNQLNASMKEFSEPIKIIQNLLEANINGIIGEDTQSIKAKRLNLFRRTLGSALEHGKDSDLQAAFKTQPATILTEDTAKVLKEVSAVLNEIKAKCNVFDRFAFMKVAQSQETILANSWNEMFESLMTSMKFSQKEINLAKYDREAAGEILRNKLEIMSTDKEAFSKFIDSFGQLLSEFNAKMTPLLNTEGEEAHLYHKKVGSAFDDSAKQLREKNMWKTANSLVGYDKNAETSLKGIYMSFLTDRIKSVKYSFYRFLDTASVYYRIAQGYNLDNILPADMYREAKEEAVEQAKSTLIEGHTSDTSVKMFQKRNLFPDRKDCSQIEIENGKVKNKYLGSATSKDLAELSNDNEFFEKVMKIMYGDEIHPDIVERIKNAPFWEDFVKYRQDALDFIGCDEYFAKVFHKVGGKKVDSPSIFKFTLMGCAPDEMFYKWVNQKYNSQKWFSMVGKIGAGLIGVTLAAQFFIGKTQDPKKIQQEAVK